VKRSRLARKAGLRSGGKTLARGAGLKRGTSRLTRTAMKPHRPKPKPWACEPLRAYVRSLPCVVPGCLGKSQACHVRSRGAGGVDFWNLYPGCARHHLFEEHGLMGQRGFEALHRLNLHQIAWQVSRDFLLRAPGDADHA
jgi:hypothetical protein